MNLGIVDIRDSHSGKPALVLGAGPSFSRALHKRAMRTIRDRFLVVAVQTVLKPLLGIGVVPHYVCAVDWSEVCARFYDGLTAKDVEGCDLVCTSQSSPVISELWPGRLRMHADQFLDTVLQEPNLERLGMLPPCSNVGNFGYELARWCGADPVILLGHDLAYVDGLYYGKGAAIHGQWACEVNEFRSLEQMEQERISRNGSANSAVPGIDGGRVRAEPQMICYLHEMEARIARDSARGCSTWNIGRGGAMIEGAVRKRFREVMNAT